MQAKLTYGLISLLIHLENIALPSELSFKIVYVL